MKHEQFLAQSREELNFKFQERFENNKKTVLTNNKKLASVFEMFKLTETHWSDGSNCNT